MLALVCWSRDDGQWSRDARLMAANQTCRLQYSLAGAHAWSVWNIDRSGLSCSCTLSSTRLLVGWRSSLLGWRSSLVGWRPSLLGWRPSLVGWRPSLVGWRPLLNIRLEAIVKMFEAITWGRPLLVGWRPSQLGWRPSLARWSPSLVCWRPSLGGWSSA